MSDALKAASDICDRQGWNHDIIPELAKELVAYAASLRTPTLEAGGRDFADEVAQLMAGELWTAINENGSAIEAHNEVINIRNKYAAMIRPHLRTPERDAEIRREAYEACARAIETAPGNDEGPYFRDAARICRSLT